MKSWFMFCARFLLLALCLGAAGCSSLESDATSGTSTKTPVPGEVNPDAPDAAQNVRTSPGWNF